MRRRRLALRQIAETTQDVSDIDGNDSDAQDQQPPPQSADEPTFNLLTVTTGAGVASTAILLSDDDEVDDTTLLQQHERTSRPSPMISATKKPVPSVDGKVDGDKKTAAVSSSSIFHLYQEGLASDQVLQLAFTRRRAPRLSRMKNTKPGDEFVLPLPTLSIKDLLPPVDVDIRDLFASDASSSAAVQSSASSLSVTNKSASEDALNASSRDVTSDVLASAKAFFFTPEAASPDQRRSWQAISNSEWHQLYQDLQKEHSTAAAHAGRSSKLKTGGHQQLTIPSVDAVCLLLRDCHSDAFAHFVWETLLLPVLEVQLASSPSSVLQDRDSRTQELFRLLLRQDCFCAMTPKAFRANVRTKKIREQLSDAAFGAHVELQLLALYHSNRPHDWAA